MTEFFEDADTDYAQDGTTRASWVADTLAKILAEPTSSSNILPDSFTRVIDRLMDSSEATNEDEDRPNALGSLMHPWQERDLRHFTEKIKNAI